MEVEFASVQRRVFTTFLASMLFWQQRGSCIFCKERTLLKLVVEYEYIVTYGHAYKTIERLNS